MPAFVPNLKKNARKERMGKKRRKKKGRKEILSKFKRHPDFFQKGRNGETKWGERGQVAGKKVGRKEIRKKDSFQNSGVFIFQLQHVVFLWQS